jgi:hypothetical protein
LGGDFYCSYFKSGAATVPEEYGGVLPNAATGLWTGIAAFPNPQSAIRNPQFPNFLLFPTASCVIMP